MIDIVNFYSLESPLSYRHSSYDSGYLDDQLWVLAMSTAWYLDEIHCNIGEMRNTAKDAILWRMICRGVIDHNDKDKSWDSSTHAMRHSVIIGDWLS